MSIDFGTRNSISCVLIKNQIHFVQTGPNNSEKMPSVVCFMENQTVRVGFEAVELEKQAEEHSRNTIFDVKCLLGAKFDS